MAEVLRVVLAQVELRAARPELDPVTLRGITLAPRHGTPVVLSAKRYAAMPARAALAV